MTTKKNWGLALVGVVIVALVVAGVAMWGPKTDEGGPVFELSAQIYEQTGVVELTAEEYEAKLEAGESFLVLARSVACPTGMPLTDLTRELAAEKQMTIYSLMQGEFRASSLNEWVKFLPSMAIIHDGQVVKWLDAESDADLPAYQSLDGLTDWLSKYVKL